MILPNKFEFVITVEYFIIICCSGVLYLPISLTFCELLDNSMDDIQYIPT